MKMYIINKELNTEVKKYIFAIFIFIVIFLINIDKIHAEEGYCLYSLTKFSDNYAITFFQNDNDVTLKLKIDTDQSNKVFIEWSNVFDSKTSSQKDYQITASNGSIISYKIDFDINKLYDDILTDNTFSCPKLYGLLSNSSSLSIYNEPRSTNGGNVSVELQLLDSKKIENVENEKLINECGGGIIDPTFVLPEKMTISFKKYTNRNEVCINYFNGASFCKNFDNQDRLEISSQSELINRTFRFKKNDLIKIFSNINQNSATCQQFWIDNTEQATGIYDVSLEKPEGGLEEGMTPEDYNKIKEEESKINGSKFKELLGSLKTPLSFYASGALSIPLTIDGNKNATLNDVDANNLLCSGGECSTNGKYYTEQGLRNIRQYCNELYSNSDKYKNSQDSYNKRLDECVDFFNGFYNELINQGIIENLSNYCGVLSQDFAAKLKYFLNIIKIAGPLLALGLGTVDFVKVLANGDADKEMKNAFKRFLTRLGAAALLFLVPIILAFLLDLFMKPGLGYDSNNPFCDIVDWNG